MLLNQFFLQMRQTRKGLILLKLQIFIFKRLFDVYLYIRDAMSGDRIFRRLYVTAVGTRRSLYSLALYA